MTEKLKSIFFVALTLVTSLDASAAVLSFDKTISADGMQGASMAVFSSDGKYLYVPQFNDQSLRQYAWDATQRQLTLIATYKEGAASGAKTITGLGQAWQAAISSDQRHVYVISKGVAPAPSHPETLAVFDRNTSDGTLMFNVAYADKSGNISGIAAPSAMALSPGGTALYVVSGDGHTLSEFHVDVVSGQLTFVQGMTHGASVDGLNAPSAITVAPDHRFIYVADMTDRVIGIYARDGVNGSLKFTSVIATGGAALNMAASPDGAYLYVPLFDKNSVAVYARDAASGALTLSGTVVNGSGNLASLVNPYALAFSPDASKLIVAGIGADAVVLFRRHPLTGALTLIEEHHEAGLRGTIGVVVEPRGDNIFAYGSEPAIALYAVQTADLRVTVTPPAAIPAVNQTATYRYNIADASGAPGPFISGMALTARIPDGIEVTSAATSQGACAQQAAILTCELGGYDTAHPPAIDLALTPRHTSGTPFRVEVFSEQSEAALHDNAVSVVLPYVAPIATDDSAIVQVGNSVTIDVLRNDSGASSADALSVSAVDAVSAGGGTVVRNGDNTVTYTPKPGYLGWDAFSYTMRDATGATASAQVHVYVNAPPSAGDDNVGAAAGETVTLYVLANDSDPNVTDTLTVAAVDSPTAHGGVAVIGDKGQYITYRAPENYSGDDVFSYIVNDGNGGRATAIVTINVKGVKAGQNNNGQDPSIPLPAPAPTHGGKKGGGAVDCAWLSLVWWIARRRATKNVIRL